MERSTGVIIPRIGDIIKHERFMDVAIQIGKPVIVTKTGKLKIKGSWINSAFVESFVIGPLKYFGRSEIVIMPEKRKEWMICDNPNAVCIRHEGWTRLK